MRRRSVLAAVSGGVLALGGCSNPLQRDTVLLDRASVYNLDESRSHEIHVRIVYDDAEIYDEVHSIPPVDDGFIASGVVIEDELPDDPGRFELAATVSEQSGWERLDVTACASADCTHAFVMAHDSDRLGLSCTDTCRDEETNRSNAG